MKNILCRLGFHRPDKYYHIKVTRRHSKNGKKYHRNYIFCEKCGKRLATFTRGKKGGAA